MIGRFAYRFLFPRVPLATFSGEGCFATVESDRCSWIKRDFRAVAKQLLPAERSRRSLKDSARHCRDTRRRDNVGYIEEIVRLGVRAGITLRGEELPAVIRADGTWCRRERRRRRSLHRIVARKATSEQTRIPLRSRIPACTPFSPFLLPPLSSFVPLPRAADSVDASPRLAASRASGAEISRTVHSRARERQKHTHARTYAHTRVRVNGSEK